MRQQQEEFVVKNSLVTAHSFYIGKLLKSRFIYCWVQILWTPILTCKTNEQMTIMIQLTTATDAKT